MQLARVNVDATARLRLAFILTAIVLVVEVVGGLWAHSLALLSDAGHVVTDLLVLALSTFALGQVQRPASPRRSFGYQRVGILVALLNAVLLGAIVVGIVVEAVLRLQHPSAVRGGVMAAAAVLGLGISLLIARSLQPMERDLTVRSALMHIWGDAWASAGIIVAGLLIALTGWLAIDPWLSLGIAALIAWSAWRGLAAAIDTLPESAPSDPRTAAVVRAVKPVPGVRGLPARPIAALRALRRGPGAPPNGARFRPPSAGARRRAGLGGHGPGDSRRPQRRGDWRRPGPTGFPAGAGRGRRWHRGRGHGRGASTWASDGHRAAGDRQHRGPGAQAAGWVADGDATGIGALSLNP